ncbi:cytosolic 5'-nucleotidase 1A-like isoform X1 [Scyliorhinus canicula]|uniref:cytosolic 5'-nucleotidase 1A-like isoform X1 n=1 Tax=Scyliorhinus canicula TaxID=7830 RepID=UPI0018F7145F|nr:cytosolic 5'-nucleotidase 1A-like isoform X1 [Scyliorhinus canicula]
MSDTGLYALEDLDICAVPIPERSSSTKRTRGANASTNPMSDRDRNQLQVQLESNPHQAITIAVSSRTLFNMADERAIYESDGLESYVKYQLDHENEPLKKGLAFALMKALETVNFRLHELYPGSDEIFDIVLMTNNHAQVGVRLINSINHYGLSIERFCMTGGTSPINYLKAYHTNLYLSSDPMKVANALSEGIAAATMCHLDKDAQLSEKQLRVAFDGDSFIQQEQEDKSKKDYMLSKSAHDLESKSASQNQIKGFIESLGKIQRKFFAKNERLECPIRTYLITGRETTKSVGRILKKISDYGLEINETLYLAGSPKKPVLDIVQPHIFFDYQLSSNCFCSRNTSAPHRLKYTEV